MFLIPQNDLYLDLFLSSHVNRLIRQIRERAFIQYFKSVQQRHARSLFSSDLLIPFAISFSRAVCFCFSVVCVCVFLLPSRAYVSVSLSAMSTAFNVELVQLERTLAELIQEGKIAARIDSQKKILHARHSDQRNDTFADAVALGNKYASDVRALLMRLSLVENELAVRGADNKRKGGARGASAAAATDDGQADPTDKRRW